MVVKMVIIIMAHQGKKLFSFLRDILYVFNESHSTLTEDPVLLRHRGGVDHGPRVRRRCRPVVVGDRHSPHALQLRRRRLHEHHHPLVLPRVVVDRDVKPGGGSFRQSSLVLEERSASLLT